MSFGDNYLSFWTSCILFLAFNIVNPFTEPNKLLMNIAFSRILKVSQKNIEFNFRKLPAENPSFHVDLTDEKGKRIMFTLDKTGDGIWRSRGTNLPLWLIAIEQMLGKVIEEEENLNLN